MINIYSTSLSHCSIIGRKHFGKKWSNTSSQLVASSGPMSRKFRAEKETSQSATSKEWLNKPGGRLNLSGFPRKYQATRFLPGTITVDNDCAQEIEKQIIFGKAGI